jgi:Cof subfamily protein (haloacid dehalogenase superfamily)
MSGRWLIATDLDGTLFDHTLEIKPRVRRALAAAQDAGHAVTLATGRMYRSARPVAESLRVAYPLICYQGALVCDAEQEVYHRTLPLEIALDALDFAEAQDIHVNVYVDDRLFVAEQTPEAEFYVSLSPTVQIEQVGELKRFLTREPTKLVFIGTEEDATKLLPVATARWGKVAQVVRSHLRFVELTHPVVSKGRALLYLAESLGIPRENTLAIGDNLNDLSMIQAAGVGVAMGNSPPELQAAADWVAPSVWEEGLAVAIERFILLGTDHAGSGAGPGQRAG